MVNINGISNRFVFWSAGLNREENLIALGSRNFFLCLKKSTVDGGNGGAVSSRGASVFEATSSSSSCSNEVEKAVKGGSLWLKFMDFLR